MTWIWANLTLHHAIVGIVAIVGWEVGNLAYSFIFDGEWYETHDV